MIYRIAYVDLVYHLDNAEMTPELCHDLTYFSFDCLQDVIQGIKKCRDGSFYSLHFLTPPFIEHLKRLVRYHFFSCVLCVLIR